MIYHFLITQYYCSLFMKTYFYESVIHNHIYSTSSPSLVRPTKKTTRTKLYINFHVYCCASFYSFCLLIHIPNVLTDWNKLESVFHYQIYWLTTASKRCCSLFLNIHLCQISIFSSWNVFFLYTRFQYFGVYYCFRSRLSLND